MTEWHDTLAAEVAENDRRLPSQAWRLVFWGDSITMRWRKDWHVDKWGALPPPEGRGFETPYDVFVASFGRYQPHSLGVGSDQTANLWWQLQHGLLPQQNHPEVAVVMIGTNDIGFLDGCSRWEADDLAAVPGISSRIRHSAALLRRAMPNTDIVLLGVLPRGGWTLGDDIYQWPNRLTVPIAAVNNATQALARLDDRMHYLDCGAGLINAGGSGDAYADTCKHPDTTSAAARSFMDRMAAAAAVTKEDLQDI
ncbi:hypothetical protein WJX81_008043 [Elliptochloris bilobata]|uniref:SGNH hydrolase-type esterase domain-containing protein n=1 Tax=Elliptochloris bilobata TaxID=381761 RepID=A0AAW1RZU4_9CHLO